MLFKPIDVGLDKPTIRYLIRLLRVTYEEILSLIQNILNEALRTTIFELEEWIKLHVPKRTGALQNDLLFRLKQSFVKASLLRIILGTDIYYAEFVNAMSTGHVAHSGEMGYARGIGLVPLDDPEALGHFFTELVFYAKERCQINLTKAKELFIGGTTASWKTSWIAASKIQSKLEKAGGK